MHRNRTIQLDQGSFAAVCTCGWQTQPFSDRSTAAMKGNAHAYEANSSSVAQKPKK